MSARTSRWGILAGDIGTTVDNIVRTRSRLLPEYRIIPQTDGTYLSTVLFPPQFCGVEGVVHGGVLSMFFDEILGWVASQISDDWWATGYLRVDYRAPSPIGEQLRAIIRPMRQEGRKCLLKGELYAGERLCAEAEGLFVKAGRPA